MPLLAYGVSFRTAAIDIRERLAFSPDELGEALAGLRRDLDCVSEAAILSTCNRTEIYCALEARDEAPVADWLAGHRAIGKRDLEDTAYVLWEEDAARHLMRVASGLDSQVLGEPQIMGQVKAAYEVARGTGTLGPELNLLSQGALYAAKRVRTDTGIGRNPVSIAYVAVTMARQVIDLGAAKCLLIGAGETIELVARHLASAGVREIGIANRTLARADQLARGIGARAMGLGDIPRRLRDYDLVISSTDAAEHIVSASMVERAMLGRTREPSAGEREGLAPRKKEPSAGEREGLAPRKKEPSAGEREGLAPRKRPLFLVDIAVPRDIEPAAGDIDGVFLHSVDDLALIVEENAAARRHAALQAETLIDKGVAHYERARVLRDNRDLVQQFRRRADGIRQEALERARQRLDLGQDSADVMERLAHELTNKLIHDPTVAIRDASVDQRAEFLESLRALYGLE